MELLTQYFDIQKQIYEYFGYVEDWVVIPLSDERDKYWYLELEENGSGSVTFSDVFLRPSVIKKGEQLYLNDIYTQCFLPKWVYRTEDYTMICVDTHTDGNKFLSVFSNDRELVNPTPEQLEALGCW